jgi:hypothetical protein
METTIKKSSKEKVGILSTKLNAVVFEVIRNMPGKKKWDGPNLLFEMTRANIEFLRENFPDADWQFGQNRVDEIMNLIEEEAVALQNRMTKPALPPEGMHFRFKTEPKAHQLEAFHEVKDKMYFGLFWEQGLGKTKEMVDR